MIELKKWALLAALLLAPCLAYSGNPTASFTINVVTGPPVPALAQAAGFTTLAANYDFSQSQYVGSSWFDCGTGQNTSKVWHQTDQLFGDGTAPCNLIHQSNDGGALVLEMVYPAGGATPHWQEIQTGSQDGNHNVLYPILGYFEIEWRAVPLADQNITFDLWSSCTGTSSCPAGNLTMEQDYVEVRTTFGDTGYHNWAVSGGCGGHDCGINNFNPNPVDVTQYHKWAGLITATSSGSFRFCTIVDGNYFPSTPGSCQGHDSSGGSGLTSAQLSGANGRNFLMMSIGVADLVSNHTTDAHMFVKTFRVWSCANWQQLTPLPCTGSLVQN